MQPSKLSSSLYTDDDDRGQEFTLDVADLKSVVVVGGWVLAGPRVSPSSQREKRPPRNSTLFLEGKNAHAALLLSFDTCMTHLIRPTCPL